MSLERFKSGINYHAIGEAYGYKPIPEGFKELPPVDLTIDWQKREDLRKARQSQAMSRFDTPLKPSYPEKTLCTTKIPTSQGSFSLSTEKWLRKGNDLLVIHLSDETMGKEIGQILTNKKGNTWNLQDRIVDESYRGKGIASQLIHVTEECIQAYADAKGEDQVLEMEASQLTVLSLFLRKGYEVAEEDQERFAQVMSQLEAGDPQYVLASCEGDFQKNRIERKTWYVFERGTYDAFGGKIWAYDQTTESANYIRHSLRFKLRKRIEAKSKRIEDVMQGVQEDVQQV